MQTFLRYSDAMTTRTRATIADLYALPGDVQAELVQGEIITMPPTGDMPSSAAGTIFVSLYNHSQATQSGRAYTDNVGYLISCRVHKRDQHDKSSARKCTGTEVLK
jgi:hypothetical protein